MGKDKTMVTDLTEGNISRQLIYFALPLLASSCLQTAYNMVDMVIVGHYVNKFGLAAVSIGADVLHMLTFVAIGFSNAGQVIISQFVGAGRHDKLPKIIGTLFTFLLGVSIIMTVIFHFLSDDMLVWLNTDPAALSYAKDYVIVCVWGLFFIYGYNLVSAILRGMGDSIHPFMFIAVAAILNMVLDIVFVCFMGLETFGAALATVLGQALSFIWALTFLYRNREKFGFDFKFSSFGIDFEVFRPIVKLGIPMVLQSAAISFSMLFVHSYVNAYGAASTSVTGIARKISTITNMIAQSLGTASSTVMGQCIGAETYDRVPKVLLTAVIINTAVSLVMAIISVITPRGVFGIFTDDAEVLDMAVIYLPVLLLMYASSTTRAPFFSLISASGNSKLNLVVALLDGVIMRIGLAMFLGLTMNWGIKGFWYGDAIAGFMPTVIGGVYYLSGKWRTRKYILNS